jgi:hypothetical protein
LNKYFYEQFEFKNPEEKNTRFSVFSAVNTHPSSFHHKELRKIRSNIYNDFFKKFKLYFPKMNLQMLFDCLCNITSKSKYTECQFSSDFPKDDLVFRGFVNLNESGNQIFYFKKIGDKEKKIEEQIIFPRHIVLYNTKIIEECDFSTKTENEYGDFRLYFGFHLSKNNSGSIYEKNLEVIENQSIPKICCGSTPETFTDDQLKNWGVKVKLYSKRFKKAFIDDSGIIHKNPSLKDANNKNSTISFDPYTDEEKQIHKVVSL